MTSVRLSILAVILMLATPAFAVELFRYRGAAQDGGTLEYVFEAGEQNSPNAVTKEKAAEIAADFRRGSRAACSGCSPGGNRSHFGPPTEPNNIASHYSITWAAATAIFRRI